jgi:hypothetical protein
MATTIGSGGVQYPTSATNPSSPVAGQVYWNTTQKELRQYDGQLWQQVSIGDGGFKYRTVITTSYVMCGYKSGTPYNNANKMVHSTDVCTNLGNTMAYATSYSGGAPSRTKSWVFGANGAHTTANANVISLNHATDTGNSYNSANNMNTSRNDAGYAFKETEYCHITSNTTSTKFNFTTETAAAGLTGLIANGTVDGVQALCDQNKAHLYGNGTGQQLVFATDTVGSDRLEASAWVGANNQQKPINSKDRKGYIGNEGTYNAGYNYRVYDLNTNTLARTVTRPLQNSGEENFDMGQEHQYCMGMYDGAQNNRGHKFFYTTDTGYELGSGSVRTGIPGGSSGICGWKG